MVFRRAPTPRHPATTPRARSTCSRSASCSARPRSGARTRRASSSLPRRAADRPGHRRPDALHRHGGDFGGRAVGRARWAAAAAATTTPPAARRAAAAAAAAEPPLPWAAQLERRVPSSVFLAALELGVLSGLGTFCQTVSLSTIPALTAAVIYSTVNAFTPALATVAGATPRERALRRADGGRLRARALRVGVGARARRRGRRGWPRAACRRRAARGEMLMLAAAGLYAATKVRLTSHLRLHGADELATGRLVAQLGCAAAGLGLVDETSAAHELLPVDYGGLGESLGEVGGELWFWATAVLAPAQLGLIVASATLSGAAATWFQSKGQSSGTAPKAQVWFALTPLFGALWAFLVLGRQLASAIGRLRSCSRRSARRRSPSGDATGGTPGGLSCAELQNTAKAREAPVSSARAPSRRRGGWTRARLIRPGARLDRAVVREREAGARRAAGRGRGRRGRAASRRGRGGGPVARRRGELLDKLVDGGALGVDARGERRDRRLVGRLVAVAVARERAHALPARARAARSAARARSSPPVTAHAFSASVALFASSPARSRTSATTWRWSGATRICATRAGRAGASSSSSSRAAGVAAGGGATRARRAASPPRARRAAPSRASTRGTRRRRARTRAHAPQPASAAAAERRRSRRARACAAARAAGLRRRRACSRDPAHRHPRSLAPRACARARRARATAPRRRAPRRPPRRPPRRRARAHGGTSARGAASSAMT